MIHVIPREGVKVPDPEQAGTPGRHLPPEGRTVEPSDFWVRRLQDGDVTLGPVPTEPAFDSDR